MYFYYARPTRACSATSAAPARSSKRLLGGPAGDPASSPRSSAPECFPSSTITPERAEPFCRHRRRPRCRRRCRRVNVVVDAATAARGRAPPLALARPRSRARSLSSGWVSESPSGNLARFFARFVCWTNDIIAIQCYLFQINLFWVFTFGFFGRKLFVLA